MNCDQAFDAMTDPCEIDSPELSFHLASCTRCRQMFETLEPALGLFNAPVDADAREYERQDTQALMSPVQMAEQVAARLSASGLSTRTRTSRRRLLGTIFSATALGLLLCLSLTLILSGPHSSSPVMAQECTWINRSLFSGKESASVVTSTCVTCHSDQRSGNPNEKSVLINFSSELEKSAQQWQRASLTSGGMDSLIAQQPWRVGHYA